MVVIGYYLKLKLKLTFSFFTLYTLLLLQSLMVTAFKMLCHMQ
jgi:hypothetical protein